jgi:hypothetical protein
MNLSDCVEILAGPKDFRRPITFKFDRLFVGNAPGVLEVDAIAMAILPPKSHAVTYDLPAVLHVKELPRWPLRFSD